MGKGTGDRMGERAENNCKTVIADIRNFLEATSYPAYKVAALIGSTRMTLYRWLKGISVPLHLWKIVMENNKELINLLKQNDDKKNN